MGMENDFFPVLTEEEIAELYRTARGNVDAPISGRIYEPTCYHCKYQILPPGGFLSQEEPSCEIFGEVPSQYRHDDKYTCPYKVLDEHWEEKIKY